MTQSASTPRVLLSHGASRLVRDSYAFLGMVVVFQFALALALGIRPATVVPVTALVAGWSSSWSP